MEWAGWLRRELEQPVDADRELSPFLWNERDPARGAVIQGVFERELARPATTTRGILDQHNAWWQILWAERGA